MLLIGLTGGIASGKSTVARLLAEHGAVVVDADVIAREVVAPGTPGHRAILERFGRDILAPDGAIDRPALARLAFADAAALADLNAITHPDVMRVIAEQVAAYRDTDLVVVVEVPLLVETGLAGAFDEVVVVEASPETQLARLACDRAMTAEQASERIAAQATADQRRAVAATILHNDGSLGELERAVDELWNRFVDGAR